MNAASPADARAVSDEEFDLKQLIVHLWKKKFLVATITLGVAALAVGASFLLPPIYSARVSMLPLKSQGSYDLLNQFANFTGIQAPAPVNYEDMYSIIIASDQVLDPLLELKWKHVGFDHEATLFEIFGVEAEGKDPESVARASTELKMILNGGVFTLNRDWQIGYMEVIASVADDPAFAADLVNKLVDQLDLYLKRSHLESATSQADFIRERIAVTEELLDKADSAVASFVQSNAGYASSPRLVQQYNVLSRESQALLATWVELRKQLEISILDENNVPDDLVILDRATPPVLPSSPNHVLAAGLGLVLGFLLSMTLLVFLARYRS